MFLEKRNDERIDVGPIHDGLIQPIENFDNCTITLKYREQEVLVNHIRQEIDSDYSGTVYGFEPSKTEEYGDLRLGDTVRFSEKQIFGCVKHS